MSHLGPLMSRVIYIYMFIYIFFFHVSFKGSILPADVLTMATGVSKKNTVKSALFPFLFNQSRNDERGLGVKKASYSLWGSVMLPRNRTTLINTGRLCNPSLCSRSLFVRQLHMFLHLRRRRVLYWMIAATRALCFSVQPVWTFPDVVTHSDSSVSTV